MNPPSETVRTLAGNLSRINERLALACVRSGRDDDISVVAATKYLDAEGVEALARAGVRHLGENRLEALREKSRSLPADIDVEWHFIGRLQSRKVDSIVPLVGWIHTLCTTSAASRLARCAVVRRRASGGGAAFPRLIVQVNTAEDPAKDGVTPDALFDFLDVLPDELRVDGLMTMPAAAPEPEASRPAFAMLRELRDAARPRFAGRHPMRELSMGTSQDFEVAVEEGATFVRLGTVLYAPQPTTPD